MCSHCSAVLKPLQFVFLPLCSGRWPCCRLGVLWVLPSVQCHSCRVGERPKSNPGTPNVSAVLHPHLSVQHSFSCVLCSWSQQWAQGKEGLRGRWGSEQRGAWGKVGLRAKRGSAKWGCSASPSTAPLVSLQTHISLNPTEPFTSRISEHTPGCPGPALFACKACKLTPNQLRKGQKCRSAVTIPLPTLGHTCASPHPLSVGAFLSFWRGSLQLEGTHMDLRAPPGLGMWLSDPAAPWRAGKG